ncbi:MAG TPA: biotin/lipoyl-binding protein, partial [Holophagaceae bacterium]|nr:biotin/lipoyl-binding protein [Holophagaceae bacterium]
MNRNVLIFSGLALVLVIGGAATYHRGQRNAELDRQQVVKEAAELSVTTAAVENHVFRPSFAFTGNLLAVNRAELRAEVPGRVTRVLVQEGDSVKAGSL